LNIGQGTRNFEIIEGKKMQQITACLQTDQNGSLGYEKTKQATVAKT